jgi:hypothetical protein
MKHLNSRKRELAPYVPAIAAKPAVVRCWKAEPKSPGLESKLRVLGLTLLKASPSLPPPPPR